ncbi:MAG: hypothetical protein AB7I27_05965 [Bacteriovoracaceae bacterium]
MDLQELMEQSEIDMSLESLRAFFLGFMSAERPFQFHQALKELDIPESNPTLDRELENLWKNLTKNKSQELEKFFPEDQDINHFLEMAKENLDFFLTALSLAGTNADTSKNEELGNVIEELEDTVMDLDEYLSAPSGDKDGEELKDLLLDTWKDFLECNKV